MDISEKKKTPDNDKPEHEGPPVMEDRPSTPEEYAKARAAARADNRVYGISGPGDWLGEAPVIDPKKVKEIITRDVVVVGGGNGGLAAALGAVDEGATVAVLEVQPVDGFVKLANKNMASGGWYGGDIGHVNSKWLIERGFGPYNTGEIAYEFFKRSNGNCDPDLIRKFVQYSGPMMDRMMEVFESMRERRQKEDGAVELKVDIFGRRDVTVDYTDLLEHPLAINHHQHEGVSYPIVQADYKTWPCNIQFYGHQGNDLGYFNKYIMYYTQEHGADWFFEHRGIVLQQNEAGDVTGVYAEDMRNPGTYRLFRAEKGVVVAAGDFIGDEKMCWALINSLMEYGERNGQTMENWRRKSTRRGDGHKMMCWAGAVMQASPRGSIMGKISPSGPWGTVPILQLNCLGKRFYNEACFNGAASALFQQPDGLACYVADKKIWQTIYKATLDHGAPNFGLPEMTRICQESFAQIKVGDPNGSKVYGMHLPGASRFPETVYAAETLDELADFLGYKGQAKETFLAEIEHYNELCRSPEGDTDYGKDKDLMIPIDEPPFYGGKTQLSGKPSLGLATLAGVIADSEFRVARGGDKQNPIRGLYTCGNCLGNRYGEKYVTPMAGNSIGMAMTHGWLAGKNAAHAV
ncbi:MAG: FAD-binding protein [Oscillospiraceae bacterium]|jgi:hypothetical protein